MHNLEKYLGILDYALRVFSKGFPLYEILLNTFIYFNIFTPGAFRKFLQNYGKRSSLYKVHTQLIKEKNQLK